MQKISINELEIATKPVVMNTARRFTEALAETPQFLAFEETYQAFRQDAEAQMAYQALQQKQESLQMMMMLDAVDEDERLELQNLQAKFYQQESVQTYLEAQENLISLCQEIGEILSDATGLDFGSACRIGGCCG